MLRQLLVGMAAALVLQSGGAAARGAHSSHSSSSHSHSSTSRSSSHRTRSSETRSGPPTRSHKIKRDPAQRHAFQHSHPCPSTGRPYGACPGYVVDHIKALKRGGADRPSNMQWQTVAQGKAKDRWE